jgi:hypothetical protein
MTKRKIEQKSVRGWAVVERNWGFTAAYLEQERAEKEKRSVDRNGYGAVIVECTITLHPRGKKKK